MPKQEAPKEGDESLSQASTYELRPTMDGASLKSNDR